MTTATPPRWAESLLGFFLRPVDRQTVSGDLLEQYRETVHPARGRRAADAWYIRQVAGFAWRSQALWAVMLSTAFIARTTLDWLWPVADFHGRSVASTTLTAALLLSAGFASAWRSQHAVAGAVAGLTAALIAAVISIFGCALLLAGWHDPQTMAAISSSGGLAEVVILPIALLVPAIVLGTAGGFAAGRLRKILG